MLEPFKGETASNTCNGNFLPIPFFYPYQDGAVANSLSLAGKNTHSIFIRGKHGSIRVDYPIVSINLLGKNNALVSIDLSSEDNSIVSL